MYQKFQAFLQNELNDIKEAGLYKNERIIVSPQSGEITLKNGQKALNFCANNYLGLANNPQLIAAAKEALDAATIIEKTIDETYEVTFEYLQMNAVMQLMKDPVVTILEQRSDFNCTIRFSIRQREAERIVTALKKVGTVVYL